MKKRYFFLMLFLIISVVFIGSVRATYADDLTAARSNGVNVIGSNLFQIDKTIPSEYSFQFGKIGSTQGEIFGRVAVPDNVITAWNTSLLTPTTALNSSLLNDSVKNALGITYEGVKTYDGQTIDIKATVVDFETQIDSSKPDRLPVIRYDINKISIVVWGVKWIKVKYDFFKSGTTTPVSIKANTTYYDIDDLQGVTTDNTNKGLYATSNCLLKVNTVAGNKYIFEGNSTEDSSNEPTYGFTEIFEGSSISRIYSFPSLAYGIIEHSANAVVPSELPKPIKSVSKSSVNLDENFTYTIKQSIPKTNSENYYKSFSIEDTFEAPLEIKASNVTITDSSENDVSDKFNIAVSGQKLTVSLINASDSSLYDKTYIIKVKTKIKEDADLSTYKQGYNYEIPNSAVLKYVDSTNASHSENSNEVKVKYEPKYTVTVHHYKENTTESIASSTSETKKGGETYTSSYVSQGSLPAGYEPVGEAPSNASGTVESDVVVIYYYKLKDVLLTVHHYEQGTVNKLDDDQVTTKKYGDSYTTSKSNNVSSNYEYVNVSGNVSGTITSDTVVTYYYKKKQGTLNVKYLDYDTHTPLSAEKNETKNYGDEYETSSATDIPQNYTLKSTPTNYKGTINSPTTEVIYYYQKKSSVVVPTIKKEGTKEITSTRDSISYQINYSANFTDYIGKATITLIDKLPLKIDTNSSNLEGGVYNDNNKTITWTQIVDVNSYNNPVVSLLKNVKIVYKNIDPKSEVITNKITGTVKTDSAEETVENTFNTLIKINGDITVKYIEKDTNKQLSESIKTTSKVGNRYSPLEKVIVGYKLISKPDKVDYEYTESPQILTYIYEKIKLNVTTKVKGNGGTIEGDEVVLYGEDSTPDKIKIAAISGYIIDELTINGEKVDLPENSGSLTMSNFINMTEDKLVEVSFKEKAIIVDVPKTDKSALAPIIIGMIVLAIIGLVYYFKFVRVKK